MRLDMDLVRLLLLQVEGDESVDLSDYTKDQVNYHKGYLVDKGLVVGKTHYSSSGLRPMDVPDLVIVKRLTPDGHDFLDKARNSTIWHKAKNLAEKTVGTLSLHSLTLALDSVIAEAFKR